MGLLRSAWQIVNKHRTAYVAINLGYYGLVLVGMLYVVLIDPSLQEQLLRDVGGAFTEGPLATVSGAYLGGNVVAAAVLTFLVNLLAGSLLFITLPSLIVPFAGVLLGGYRAVLWGLLLAPTSGELALVMIPHSLTLILEGQAYVLTIFAAYVHGSSFLRPHRVGVTSHRQGYVAGLKMTAQVYALVLLALAAAAVYEALEVVAMVRLASASG
ncbi:MAG TPA: stage II sporulation protein M [Anaerolineae bacterium]|nr:stage II sporulation protein M [Anaerolineae bacterium]